MFGSDKYALQRFIAAFLLISGVMLSGVHGMAAQLTAPCSGENLIASFSINPNPLSPDYSISQLPHFGIEGCFAAWMPVESSALFGMGMPEKTIEIPEFQQFAASADLAPQGLFDQLQHIWDQDNFEFKRETLAAGSFSFGNIATLETERETILAFLEKVANNLIPSSQPGAMPSPQMGFTFNLDNIPLNSQMLLGSSGVFSVDDNLNVFLEDLTITVGNDTISGETQFNPENLSFESGAFSINLDIGNAKVSSTTTFEKDQGVTKQVLNLSAGLGQLQLNSQVTLGLSSSEFRLGASISDYAISTTSIVDIFGNRSQTFELELNF